ncbi:MAG TPA: sigma factor [Thermoleophilaceae bacterium]
MHEIDRLAERFEEQRARLTTVAYRMHGSTSEADDAVQEAWLRLSRADASSIENLQAWLTTVVSRVCLHDMFAVPFDDIATILGRSGPATRQLASRARRRVQTEDPARDTDRLRQARVVDAFLAAARHGDFEALLAVLDPDVVLRADETAVQLGAAAETRGAAEVAGFSRFARGAKSAFLDGAPAAAWMAADRPRVVYDFTVRDGRIVAIDLIADPDRLSGLDLTIVDQAVGPW